MADDISVNIGANPAGVEQGSRRAKVALKGVADGGRDLDAALRRLRTAIDPAYAALEKYNKVHQDNLALMRAGIITRKEYNAGMRAAKAALEQETAAIERNTAAGRARIQAEREARQQEAAANRAAKAEEARLAREASQARRQAEREAAAAAKQARAEERASMRAAAEEAKKLARETAEAERQARREVSEAQKQAKAEERAAARAAKAEESALRRQAVEEERNARRQQREAAKAAAAAAAQEARQRRDAEREASRASREAAKAAEELARAERASAQSAQQLRASIDPAYAAQARYNETMRRANELLRQQRISQAELIAIQRQAQAQRDVDVRSMGAQNAMYVQLGYQAQDVTASMASGIDPLVILAQQAGQTAAAMSGMGGVMGRVAAFVAGPWGAAIIGATLLIAYLIDANEEAETATKDVMNAEDRRKMKLKELTTSLKEYVKAQREANQTTLEGISAQAASTTAIQAEIMTKYAQAQERLAEAKERYAKATDPNLPIGDAARGDIGAARVELLAAEEAVNNLRDAYEEAQAASMEAKAAQVQAIAEMTDLEVREDKEKTKALEDYRTAFMAAGTDIKAQVIAQINYGKQLEEIQARYLKLKEDEAEARKKNEKAAKDEADAVFKSRQQAIGIAGKELQGDGYNISENVQFGGVKASHPGMGNKAHGEFAIDINVGKGNVEASDPVIRARMDAMVKAYQARGFRILWNGKVYEPGPGGAVYDIKPGANQHKDHAHMEAPQSIVGRSAGSQLANQLAQEAERQAEEARRLQEEALRSKLAFMDFEQELNQDDLQMVLDIQDQKIAAIKEFYGEASEEAANAQRERVRMERAQARESLEITRELLDQQTDLAMAAAEAERDLAAIRLDAQRDIVDFAESSGMLNPRDAIAQKAALLDEEYELQAAHEEAMYRLKESNIQKTLLLENLTPSERRELNQELINIEAEHLSRMTLMNADYARNVQAVQLASAAVTLEAWKEIGSTLSSSMASTFQGIWTHSQTLHQAFINMADQMVYKFVEMGTRMFEEWFMRQVGMTAVQQVQETARTGSAVAAQSVQTGAVLAATTAQTGAKAAAAATETTIRAATTGAALAAEAIKTSAAVTGAATQQSVGAAAGLAEIGTRAATSAAGAFSSTVVIPFIGPVAAPAAAAMALAAVLGFGALISAQGGQGEVPMDGQLSMLHKKEMVLPERFAVPLRQMLVGPRSSSGMMSSASAAGSAARESMVSQGGATFNYQPNHTNTDTSMSELLRRDGRELRRWFKNEVRNGGLKFQ